ncbi:C-_U-editing enzyme APOBEC-2 isoform X2 [Oenanthe melanoleuca]|uniref:C->U-editing enzyme APOBEC-2 isoform X2 n=1 Tax=Oenanthe melanoleuca TaxID=2939378 RepID=UPI0024C1924C|nr:C->U-editing enzyme APOBEC-2 isoform X2 [Oenanthe melanoleuca]XP_056367599.1 C->U-editing enzyme APOBEC-2 isoform X2 [Oenanthe melanoleuca]
MAEKQEEPSNAQNGEPDNAEEGEGKKKKVKREDLPPFEIVTGERLPAIFFKFQFRNVEYSSGRNKTFLCYVVETQGKEAATSRGYLEDEHAAAHAEMAFFNNILPKCQAGARHDVTWLFMWEEPEMQAALRSMKEAGCKLRIMKPQDFEYVWKNFVEQEEGEEAKSFVPWEDIQENFQYYEEKLAEILH